MIFCTWSNYLPATIEVCPIELPGRGTQMNIRQSSHLDDLVKDVAAALIPYLDKPFAFFGYSMGGLISFELARLLGRQYGIHPVHLLISGSRTPQIPVSAPIHVLPEPAFKEELRRLNGTPQAVLENVELMQLLLPMLRADFAILENYIYVRKPPLVCPITVFGGLQDPQVSLEQLEAWREHTLEF